MFESLHREPWWREMWRDFWPVLDDPEQARAANRAGVRASIGFAAVGSIVAAISWMSGGQITPFGRLNPVVLGPPALLSVSMLLLLLSAWGLGRMSRIAAVGSILVFLFEMVLLVLAPRNLGLIGMVPAGILGRVLFRGVSGTFAYHRLLRRGT